MWHIIWEKIFKFQLKLACWLILKFECRLNTEYMVKERTDSWMKAFRLCKRTDNLTVGLRGVQWIMTSYHSAVDWPSVKHVMCLSAKFNLDMNTQRCVWLRYGTNHKMSHIFWQKLRSYFKIYARQLIIYKISNFLHFCTTTSVTWRWLINVETCLPEVTWPFFFIHDDKRCLCFERRHKNGMSNVPNKKQILQTFSIQATNYNTDWSPNVSLA